LHSSPLQSEIFKRSPQQHLCFVNHLDMLHLTYLLLLHILGHHRRPRLSRLTTDQVMVVGDNHGMMWPVKTSNPYTYFFIAMIYHSLLVFSTQIDNHHRRLQESGSVPNYEQTNLCVYLFGDRAESTNYRHSHGIRTMTHREIYIPKHVMIRTHQYL